MDIHVDIRGFLESMNGYALDSRTREVEKECFKQKDKTATFLALNNKDSVFHVLRRPI